MTNEELKTKLQKLTELYRAGKISAEDAKIWCKITKELMGPCYKCIHNDGTPNGYCQNCEKIELRN